jgi:prepilin-type N-terminal cleavage/methylation domain-containing protein
MKKGFTVIELLIVIAIFCLATGLFFTQKLNYDAAKRDEQRKIAINAMFYNLEEVYYAEHNSYPETIGEDNLKAMDPQLFTDPTGFNIGDGYSSYRYEPVGCEDQKCTGYTLRTTLEKEDDFIRKSRHE